MNEEGIDCFVFPNVDAFISSWCGITAGKFDPLKVNQVGLEKFKDTHCNGEVILKCPVLIKICLY